MTPRPMYVTIPLEEYEKLEAEWNKASAKNTNTLAPVNRWRKTSEGFPKENDYYLITNGDFVDIEYGCYSEQDEKWHWDHGGEWEYWMPLPEPPEAK